MRKIYLEDLWEYLKLTDSEKLMLFKIYKVVQNPPPPPIEDVSSTEMCKRTIEENVSFRHKASSCTRGLLLKKSQLNQTAQDCI